MKLNAKTLLAKTQPGLAFLKRYRVLIFIICFAGVYTFLIMRINTLTESEPSADALNQQTQTIQRLRIDQAAVDKLSELEEQNIEVRSLFEKARSNPFSE